MGLYAEHILPRVIDLVMRNKEAARLRSEWIPKARGEVLEVGIIGELTTGYLPGPRPMTYTYRGFAQMSPAPA